MSTVMEIEKAIEELPALEFRALAAWLEVRKSGLVGECAVLSENSLAVDGKRMRPQAGECFNNSGADLELEWNKPHLQPHPQKMAGMGFFVTT
jgi:hypothetical protein